MIGSRGDPESIGLQLGLDRSRANSEGGPTARRSVSPENRRARRWGRALWIIVWSAAHGSQSRSRPVRLT